MAWLRGKPFAVIVIATSLAMLGGGQNGRIVGHAPAGKLSVGFELNQGQTDPAVKFYFRGPATTLFLTETQATLALGAGRERSAPTLPDVRDIGDKQPLRPIDEGLLSLPDGLRLHLS